MGSIAGKKSGGTFAESQCHVGQAGEDDADELSFSEFIDGIIAIVMYKSPNPFLPFPDRVPADA